MQNPDNLSYLIADLKSALQRYPTPRIQGAKLNQYIQSVVPDINVREIVDIPAGPGALKKFVSIYLDDTLKHVDYNGGDIVYEIAGHSGDLPSQVDPNIWKTFVSPNSSQNIAISADRSKIFRKKSDEVTLDEINISNVSISEHDKLREEFIDSLEADTADSLREEAKEAVEYVDWIGLVRRRGLSKRWGEFRRNGLLEIFRGRLTALDLDPDSIEQLRKQLAASQISTYAPKEPSQPAAKPAFVGGSNSGPMAQIRLSYDNKVEFGRKLAHSAVDAMSYDELRSVRLSLGAVLDALNES